MTTSNISIIIPALVIISTVLTYYSVITKIALLKIEDKNYPHWTIKYPFVMTIVVISFYTVVLNVTELSLEQKQSINFTEMSNSISVIQNFLAAALIPLIIGIIFNVNTDKKQKLENHVKTIDKGN